MLTHEELILIQMTHAAWTGPNTWGWRDKYKLDFEKTLTDPGFG